jgi:capsular polysaccharide biosynthesis protein
MFREYGLLRRFWWIAAVTTVTVAAIALVVAHQVERKVAADAIVVVSPGAPVGGSPGNGDQAEAVAEILTALIPNDHATLSSVARTLGVPYQTVSAAVSATNEQSTSLIDLTYTAASPALAQRGATLLATAVSGAHPVSPNIPHGSLQIVALPRRPPVHKLLIPALPIGLVLGLLLGGVLATAAARSRPRVRNAEDLREVAGCPTVTLSRDTAELIESLVSRLEPVGGSAETRVAFVPVNQEAVSCAQQLVERVNRIAEELGNSGEEPPSAGSLSAIRTPRRRVRAVVTPIGTSDSVVSAASAALEDAAILVAPAGSVDTDVEPFVRSLHDYKRPPILAVLAPAPRRRLRKQE